MRTRSFYLMLKWMMEKHGSQRYDSFPYGYHPLAVADVAYAVGLREQVSQLVCLGHDLLEDTPADVRELEQFIVGLPTVPRSQARRIVEGIVDLTDDPRHGSEEKHKDILLRISHIRLQHVCYKLADRYVNVGGTGLSQRKISRNYWRKSLSLLGAAQDRFEGITSDRKKIVIPAHRLMSGISRLLNERHEALLVAEKPRDNQHKLNAYEKRVLGREYVYAQI